MEVEIRPEPSDEERAAIEAALARLLAGAEGAREPGREWWRAGAEESLEEEDFDP